MNRKDFLKKSLLTAGGFTAGTVLKANSLEASSAFIENPISDPPVAALNIFELEQLAKEKLPVIAYDYYRSGAWDEVTLKANREAFEKIKIHSC